MTDPRIEHSGASADVFDGLAELLRVRPELNDLCRFGAQWASEHAPEGIGWAPFHIVTKGACVLQTADGDEVALKAGDVAVLPHGAAHTIKAAVSAAGGARAIETSRRLESGLTLKTNGEGAGETELVCGRLRFEQARDNMILAALPPLLIISAEQGRDADRIGALVGTIREELEDDRLGAATVASDLARALMVIVLRAYFDPERSSRGVLALLGQRQTGRALAAMLACPEKPWTLDELAAEARTSRATLVRMFQKAAGIAPLAFLGELRLSLARKRLAATSDPIAVIAQDVGYSSESAFSRAYSRRYGAAPGGARRRT
jgi:AraC family transcriptional activator of mtrCDE